MYGPEEAESSCIDPYTELAQVVEGPHLGTYVDPPPAPKQELGPAAFEHPGSTGGARTRL